MPKTAVVENPKEKERPIIIKKTISKKENYILGIPETIIKDGLLIVSLVGSAGFITKTVMDMLGNTNQLANSNSNSKQDSRRVLPTKYHNSNSNPNANANLANTGTIPIYTASDANTFGEDQDIYTNPPEPEYKQDLPDYAYDDMVEEEIPMTYDEGNGNGNAGEVPIQNTNPSMVRSQTQLELQQQQRKPSINRWSNSGYTPRSQRMPPSSSMQSSITADSGGDIIG